MKKHLVAGLVLCAAVCGWPMDHAYAVNLVVNGDFESGLEPDTMIPVGWQWFGVGDNTVSLSTDTPSGSGSSADLNIQEVLGLPWLVQDIDISTLGTGTKLTLTASVKEERQFSPDFDAWIAAQVYLLPSSESGAILASGFAFYTSPTWETQSFDIIKPSGANIARILFTPQDPGFGIGTGRYLIDDVVLSTPTAGLLGDYNEDGAVDAADYTVWRDNFGAATTLPNANPDAMTPALVDQEDHAFWVSHYGAVATPISVPEPSAVVIALSIGVFIASRSCRV